MDYLWWFMFSDVRPFSSRLASSCVFSVSQCDSEMSKLQVFQVTSQVKSFVSQKIVTSSKRMTWLAHLWCVWSTAEIFPSFHSCSSSTQFDCFLFFWLPEQRLRESYAHCDRWSVILSRLGSVVILLRIAWAVARGQVIPSSHGRTVTLLNWDSI
jgi:hypothetical protein